MKPALFILVANELSDEQREKIQDVVKANADGWWHHMPNVWLLSGKTATAWRDLVKDIVAPGPAGILVFKVDTVFSGGWSGYTQKKMYPWLHENWKKHE